MKSWIFNIAIYGTEHGGALMHGEVNARDEAGALAKAKSISLLMGHEISRITAELRYDEKVRWKVEMEGYKVSERKKREYYRWGLVAPEL